MSPHLHHYWSNTNPLHLSLVSLGLISLLLLLLLSILHTLEHTFCKHKSYHVSPLLKCFSTGTPRLASRVWVIWTCPLLWLHFTPEFQLLDLSVPLTAQTCSCPKAFALAGFSVWTASSRLYPLMSWLGCSNYLQLKYQFFRESFLTTQTKIVTALSLSTSLSSAYYPLIFFL